MLLSWDKVAWCRPRQRAQGTPGPSVMGGASRDTPEPAGLGSGRAVCCTHGRAAPSPSTGSHVGRSQPVEITVEEHHEVTQASDVLGGEKKIAESDRTGKLLVLLLQSTGWSPAVPQQEISRLCEGISSSPAGPWRGPLLSLVGQVRPEAGSTAGLCADTG